LPFVNDAIKDDAERKQVTVLFADVSGSMDLAEQEDPEEWREIMQRFFSLLAETVTHFEGTVDKFTGDGIMAIFGAPVAHEDHARRACYAALQMLDDVAGYAAELRRAKGLNFSTRIGVNSGEVVAGAIDGGGGSAYTAIGHTVGLAQRMEALAEPGKAYLTESTAELARGYLDLEDLGKFEIKGASRPVQVFELAGVGQARSRLDLARERGFSQFVGREEELGRLEEALARAKGGEATAVGVVAEPGIGKSRLYHEFAQRCRGEGLEIFEAQGQAHGKSIPFMPILQMLRSFYGIDDQDAEQLAREKIAGRSLLLDPAFADDLPLIFDFLGVPDPERPVPRMDPEVRQRALAGFLCRLVSNPARRKVLVLVIEDLHWIDEGSKAMLNGLVEGMSGTPTLVLVNYRPEYEPAWKGSQFETIALQPLDRADTAKLLRDLAGSDPSLDGIDEPIHERTSGNPFFIEEIVRELAESGYLHGERGAYRLAKPIEDAGVPVTVQAVLAARIDRLDPAAKNLLQVASVVGKEVSGEALSTTAGHDSETMERALGELIDGGFLYEAELYPERVLAFRHPLTREVAYGTQLAEQRAATHAAAARALIALEPPERYDELSALIADHLRQGGERLEAARWSARGAHWAGHSRPRDALRLWHDVMELTAGLDAEDEEVASLAIHSRLLQLQYAWRVGMGREEEARLAAEAEEVATRQNDLHSLVLLKVATAVRPGLPHHGATWIEAVRETIELADRSGDRHLRAAVRGAGAYAYLCVADFEGFEEILDEMLEIVGGDSSVGANIVLGSPIAWGLMGKGMVRRERLEFEQAEELFEQALEAALEQEDAETASWIRSNLASLVIRRDPEAALAIARRNVELTDRLGDVFSRSLALSNLAWTQMIGEEYEEALEAIEESERLYRGAMDNGGEMEGWRGQLRARALVLVGRTDEGLELAEESARVARERGMLWSYPVAMLTLARARAAAGVPGVSEAFDEAERVARETGATTLLMDIEEEREQVGSSAGPAAKPRF
jgi:class 3 adenylate cyclase/tetratricopeptide (TPR) repeat protein